MACFLPVWQWAAREAQGKWQLLSSIVKVSTVKVFPGPAILVVGPGNPDPTRKAWIHADLGFPGPTAVVGEGRES